MTPALIFILRTVVQLFLLVLLLRFWLPWLRADFRNPVAQGILRITSPIIVPLRRVIPPIGRLDTATIVIILAVQYLALFVIYSLIGIKPGVAPLAITALIELIILSLNIFSFAILILIVLSWIAPGTYNPATAFVSMVAGPVLQPFRKRIPPLGGLDLSPMIAIILLQALKIYFETIRPVMS
jgi:YggT family protein